MNKGLGVFVWQIAVAVFLIAIAVMGFSKSGDLDEILGSIFKGDVKNILVIVASIIALLAGVGLVFELLGAQISFLSTLIFVVAIVWAVFIVLLIIKGLKSGFSMVLLRELAVYTMVLGSLLGASGKFGN